MAFPTKRSNRPGRLGKVGKGKGSLKERDRHQRPPLSRELAELAGTKSRLAHSLQTGSILINHDSDKRWQGAPLLPVEIALTSFGGVALSRLIGFYSKEFGSIPETQTSRDETNAAYADGRTCGTPD